MSKLEVNILQKKVASNIEIQDNLTIVGNLQSTASVNVLNTIPYLTHTVLTPADTVAIDWSTNIKAYCLLDRATTTFTFTNPTHPTTLILELVQGSGGSKTASFPATVKWLGQSATLSTTAGAIDIVNFYWDGTTYFASILNSFQTL